MDKIRELVAERIESDPELNKRNVSLALGMSHSFIYQYLSKGSPAELDETIRPTLAKMLGVDEEELMTDRQKAAAALTAIIADQEGKPFPPAKSVVIGAQRLRLVPYAGEVKAGRWEEIDEIDQTDHEPVEVNIRPEDAGFEMFVVTVRGDSMNLEFRDGDRLACIKADNGLEIPSGAFVVVERRQWQSGLRERSVKQVEVLEDSSYRLWPRSTNPKHQEPLDIPPLNKWNEDHAQDEIEGVVIGIVRYVVQRDL